MQPTRADNSHATNVGASGLHRPAFSVPPAISDWIERHARWLLAAVVLINLSAFNGIWRPSPDSAVYRELARNIARGAGYTYHGEPERLSYPALPYLLAGLQLAFGSSALPILIIMMACALLALFLTYRLISLDYPRWVAVMVTVIMGLAPTFGIFALEILTDIPFLVGVLLVLYGYRYCAVRVDTSRWRVGVPLAVIGLGICIIFRPTGVLVLGALPIAIAVDLRHKWRQVLLVVGATAVLVLVWIAVDPRAGTPIVGGYDRWWGSIVATLFDVKRLWLFTRSTLDIEMVNAIFGQRMLPVLGTLLVLVTLVGVALVSREHFLGALLVFILVVLGILARSTPRYFLMVLPILILGWLRITCAISQRVPARHAKMTVLLSLAIIIIPNLVYCVNLHRGQIRAAFVVQGSYRRQLDHVQPIAALIREHVQQDGKVLASDAAILSFLSERLVKTPVSVLHEHPPAEWPARASEMGFTHVVLPLDRKVGVQETATSPSGEREGWAGEELGSARGFTLVSVPRVRSLTQSPLSP